MQGKKQEGTEKSSLKGALISRVITFSLHILFAGSPYNCKKFVCSLCSLRVTKMGSETQIEG